jgi:hypothetical protein
VNDRNRSRRCLLARAGVILPLAESQATLDRGYGKPHQAQSIDANITEGPMRYVEVPRKAESAEAWLRQQGHAGRRRPPGASPG